MTPPMVVHGPVDLESLPSAPWKNSAGSTRTLATEPENAGLENFAWRISLAEVRTSGSFSVFPAVDRTILLWSGEGMVLRSPGWDEHALIDPLKVFCFDGAQEVSCELVGAPSSDLNLMLRREIATGKVVNGHARLELEPPWDDVVVICATGEVHIALADGRDLRSVAGQFIRISNVWERMCIVPAGKVSRYVCVTIRLLA